MGWPPDAFSRSTKLIAPTYLGRKHAKYDQTGYVPGISSASRGNAFDRRYGQHRRLLFHSFPYGPLSWRADPRTCVRR